MPNASDNFGDPDICDTKKNKAAKITFSLNTMILRELGGSLNLILHYRESDFYSRREEQLTPLLPVEGDRGKNCRTQRSVQRASWRRPARVPPMPSPIGGSRRVGDCPRSDFFVWDTDASS